MTTQSPRTPSAWNLFWISVRKMWIFDKLRILLLLLLTVIQIIGMSAFLVIAFLVLFFILTPIAIAATIGWVSYTRLEEKTAFHQCSYPECQNTYGTQFCGIAEAYYCDEHHPFMHLLLGLKDLVDDVKEEGFDVATIGFIIHSFQTQNPKITDQAITETNLFGDETADYLKAKNQYANNLSLIEELKEVMQEAKSYCNNSFYLGWILYQFKRTNPELDYEILKALRAFGDNTDLIIALAKTYEAEGYETMPLDIWEVIDPNLPANLPDWPFPETAQ